MEQTLKQVLKTLKVNENLISTMMGTLVVIIMGVMIFNYFKGVNRVGQLTEGTNIDAVSGTGEEKTGKVAQIGEVYKVEKGDNLWLISEKVYGSGYNYVDIVKENKLVNADQIEVGMELVMPDVPVKQPAKVAGASQTQEQEEVTTYTTKAGDHLWKIAIEQYKDGYAWTKIYNANKTKIGMNPSNLAKDIVLTIPRL
jgi:nucleoid-associated protein YgaU